MKKIKCDVVVVGAGPGGSMAAKTCAKYGLDTVLVERKDTPGKTNCAMCLVGNRLGEYVHINDKIITSPLTGITFYCLEGTDLSYRERDGYDFGYTVNRNYLPDTLDSELVKLAVRDGTELMLKTMFTGLIIENGKMTGIKAIVDGKEDIEIRSNIVIGADGVESKVGRYAGIYKNLDIGNIIAVYTMDNPKMDEDDYPIWWQWNGYKNMDAIFAILPDRDGKVVVSCQPHFPKGRQQYKGQMLDYLNGFVKDHPFLEGANIVKRGGGAWVVHPLKRFVTDNVMLVGDAACQGNWPNVPAGLIFGMDGGRLAGEVAVEAYEEGDFSYNLLSRYEDRYNRLHGEEEMIGYAMLEAAFSLPYKEFDGFFCLLKENNYNFTDEFFSDVFKSPKFTSNLLYHFKDLGFDIPDLISFGSLLKKYYRNFWDTFVE